MSIRGLWFLRALFSAILVVAVAIVYLIFKRETLSYEEGIVMLIGSFIAITVILFLLHRVSK